MMNNKMQQYQANQISTASSEQILLMLYDGAIRFTRQAIEGIEHNDQNMKRTGISKAMAIISEFSNSLDRKMGGHFADDLDALYDFMIRQLTEANLKNDKEKLATVEKLLVDLRQTWGEAVEISKKGAAETVPEIQKEKPEQVRNPHLSGYGQSSKEANYNPLSISG